MFKPKKLPEALKMAADTIEGLYKELERLRPLRRLFRIESERLKLLAPFCRRIAKPLYAAGQATFNRCFDKIGRER